MFRTRDPLGFSLFTASYLVQHSNQIILEVFSQEDHKNFRVSAKVRKKLADIDLCVLEIDHEAMIGKDDQVSGFIKFGQDHALPVYNDDGPPETALSFKALCRADLTLAGYSDGSTLEKANTTQGKLISITPSQVRNSMYSLDLLYFSNRISANSMGSPLIIQIEGRLFIIGMKVITYSGISSSNALPYTFLNFVVEAINNGTLDSLRGVNTLGLFFQPLKNHAERAALQLGPDKKGQGVKIIKIPPHHPLENLIKPNDVLLAVNGQKVTSSGLLLDERLEHYVSPGFRAATTQPTGEISLLIQQTQVTVLKINKKS